jgi:cellulose synthase operon protein C
MVAPARVRNGSRSHAACTWVIACGLGFLIGGGLACRSNPQAAKARYVQKADAFVANSKYPEAIIEYRNAVQQDGQDGQVRAKLAETYLKAGDVGAAVREYARAADLLPQDVPVLVKAGNLLLLAQRYDDAKGLAEKALVQEPQNVEAQVMLANAMAGLQDLDSAVAQIEDAIRAAPGQASIYSNLGALELGRGKADAAERAFRKAVDLDPRSVSAHLALANFEWVTGKWQSAEQSLKTAVTLAPDNALANRALASFYLATNRRSEAEQPLRKVLDLTKTPAAAFALADYYTLTGNPAAARTILEPLERAPKTSVEASIRIAALEYAAGQHDKAYAQLAKVLATDETNVQALVVRSDLLLSEGKLDEALAAASKAAESHPDATAAQFALGRVQAARRQVGAATKAYQEVLRLNPRATAAKLALANLSLAQGQADTAVGLAEEVLNNEPANAEARLALVRGLLARGEFGPAERELNRLAERFPNSPAVHAQMGFLLGRQGKVAPARKEFERVLELDPDSVEGIIGLTTLDLAAKRLPEARARIDARLAKGRETAPLLAFAAQVSVALKDLKRAESLLRQAIALDANYLAAYSALGQLYINQRQLDSARAEFEVVAQRSEKPVSALTMLGLIFEAEGNTAAARERYERALQVDPNAPVAANNLAWIYAQDDANLDMALQLAQVAKRGLPDSAEVNDTLGFVYYKKDLAPLAISTLKLSVDKDPANPVYQYHLGLAQAKAGDTAQAKRSLARALQLKSDFAGAEQAREVLNSLGPS